MRARYYNPEIKRFINQDVIEGNITNSPSLNRYAYCQGNPVSLLDPFGLSPQINVDWSGLGEAGHGVLSLLGMMPTVGSVFDMINAAWYFSEGNYGEAALSFFGALPGIGDIAVAGAKAFNLCTKGAKIFRLAAKIIGNAGNIALAVPKATEAIIQLWDKHVIRGQGWDDESLSIAIEGATFGVTAILSAKNLGETIGNIRGELTDIVTSQCFVEGTLIVTNEGDKPIEEIQAGDLVYSTNPETGESEYKEVLRTFRKESDVLIHIFVNGEEIQTTPVHPFWVEDQWVAAKDLETGDILTLADGSTAPITRTYGEKLEEPVIVYNFEVADFHTYYVTDTGVLVHNANKKSCSHQPYDVVEYGDKSNNTENHHGVLDVWLKNNVDGYKSRSSKSTSIALTKGQHDATKAVYRQWLFERTGRKVGGKIDWKNISSREIMDLSERMFDAANVPTAARNNYYSELTRYLYGLAG